MRPDKSLSAKEYAKIIHETLRKINYIKKVKPLIDTLKSNISNEAGYYGTTFHNLEDDQWKDFCDALSANTSVETLALRDCMLDCLTPDRWEQFCNIIASHKSLKALDLTSNELNQMSEKSWIVFANALSKNTTLRRLNLQENFERIDPKKWNAFCSIIRDNKTLTQIILTDDINVNKEEDWQALCKAIEINKGLQKIHWVIQSKLDHPWLTEKRWKLFCEAIYNNARISNIEIPPDNGFFAPKRVTELRSVLKDKLKKYKTNYPCMVTLGQILYNLDSKKDKNRTPLSSPLVKQILSFFEHDFMVDKTMAFLNQYQNRKLGKTEPKSNRGWINALFGF